MLLAIGGLVVLAVVYLMVKQYETRLVLFCAGFFLALVAGEPMAPFKAFSHAMQAAEGLARGPGLFVFVSLSMPRPALQRLIDQAARARASVILRGLVKGSLRETVAQLQPLIGTRQVAVQIDPPAFDRFSIVRVPSFVLVRDGTRPVSCASGTCAPPEAFLRTAGDVSLDYALEHMVRTAPAFQGDAAGFLQRLKE